MAYQRIDRISEEVRREIDRIVRDELNDPRISGTYSITRADVARDLSHAKVYVSVLEEEKRADLLKALNKAAGFIRRELGRNMIIRYSPELTFVSDENIAYGVKISQILGQVMSESAEKGENEDEQQ